MHRRWLRIFLALSLGALLAHWLWRREREHRFDPIIVAAAARYGVDPALVKAVIWRESRFDPGARGAAGEIGLMQIREPAAFEWAEAEKKPSFHERQLFDPAANIHAGSWYLAKLLRRYRGTDDPVPFALSDYNAGRAHSLRWARGAARTNSAEFLAQMDFPGTRRYIEAVRARREQYQPEFAGKR